MAGNEAPPFWFRDKGWQAVCLSPAGWAYGAVARWRMDNARPPEVMAPVLCIGNLTVGGSGKTPTAIAIGKAAREAGRKPGFLTRGYGGSHVGPHLVDLSHDTASAVGDEPLLLARVAPTVVARKRVAGAEKLVAEGVDFIIMDDGFQSRGIHFDYALVVFDARRGIGNGSVIPAGPLRAPVVDQMRHADAVLRIGSGKAGSSVVRAAARAAKPTLRAELRPDTPAQLRERPLCAFSGIGDPARFFETLRGEGCDVAVERAFPDHHVFSEADAADLLATARSGGLQLVTTEKDAARLSRTEGALGELRGLTATLPVQLVFDSKTAVDTLIAETIEAYHRRRITRTATRP